MRVYDAMGRYGGEEFLLVLPGCNLTNVVDRGNQLREFVASTPIVSVGIERAVTVSMGVAVTSGSGHDVQLLRGQADEGLYVAKEKGRNRVECASAVGARK